MKKLYIIAIIFLAATAAQAQAEFAKHLIEAKKANSAGKLDDARFAMQQMLNELDIITGKEVLKLLPQKLEDLNAVTAKDDVTGTSGFLGVSIHREYGTGPKMANLDIITNSPLIGTVNAILAIPLIGGASAENKVIKINGYKALVQKVSGENNRSDYELQMPLNNSMIILKAPGYTQEQVIKMANTFPITDIVKILQ